MFRAAVLIVALVAPAAFAAQPSWIEESNKNAQILLDVMARYNAESAATFGVEGHDSEIFDLKPQFSERQEADLGAAITRLEQLRSSASDALVRRDLDILIGAARDQKHSLELNRQLTLPFFDVGQAVFGGFQNLLDARVPRERQKAALTRLHRYVGAETRLRADHHARAQALRRAGRQRAAHRSLDGRGQAIPRKPAALSRRHPEAAGRKRLEGLAEGHASAAQAIR